MKKNQKDEAMGSRKLFLVAIIGIGMASTNLKAQTPFSGGIIGGISTGSVKINDIDSGFVNVIEGKNIMGYELGVYGRAGFGPFYARPELLYNFRGGKVSDDQSSSNFRIHKLEVPLMLGLKFLGPVCVEAGPVWDYVLKSTERYNENTVDLAKNGLGYRIGAGLDFDRVLFNLSYQGMTYKGESTNRATFREPYKLIFRIGVRLGE